MPTIAETNTSKDLNAVEAKIDNDSLNVINTLDTEIIASVQTQLAPVYEQYPLLTKTIWGIPFANLGAAILLFMLILLLRKAFTRIVLVLLQNFAKNSNTYYDDRVISALKEPVRFAFIVVALHVFFLLIYKETDFIVNILDTLIIYTLFWAILSVTEALRGLIYKATAQFNKDLSKEMGNFILTILKILIGGIGLGAMLKVWGVNVTALVASLGLGGLAFALAAKDTASNLFGSFALLADKSIRIGEWVKIGSVEGVVEDVGMRTTKIRSFQKSLITVPNQVVANTPIENFSRRGIRRIKMTIGLTYGTTSEQITQIIADIKSMLQNHEGIAQDESLMVNFNDFGDSSLNIFIYTFAHTANWAKYLDIREDIHLKIMKIVEENGSSFAFPSQSVYVESLPKEEKGSALSV
ncbi:mechanosensitive ion channel family protein [Sulfurovum riftiae]|uniref:Mechanosensitive ion channel protein MscS n=1 Tax=Sulfurovum riftiae TaxID=1630136 RepID=A0A151CFI5_9BACT|nr:mechanosensitive ion channel family protein [Sulfurovum riftiae]KYJ86302.1 mechanosensitive ion channel protein MscS [Sulfurovum riftiae]